MYFRRGEYAVSYEQSDIFLVGQVGKRLGGVFIIGKSAHFRFLYPLGGIVVAVEYHLAVFGHGLGYYFSDGRGNVAAVFYFLGKALQRVGDYRIQDKSGVGNGHRRAGHAEFEFVARERERRGAVTVGGVLFEARQNVYSRFDLCAADRSVGTVFGDAFQHLRQIVAQEKRHYRRRRFVPAQTVVVTGARDADAHQVAVFVHALDDRREEQ